MNLNVCLGYMAKHSFPCFPWLLEVTFLDLQVSSSIFKAAIVGEWMSSHTMLLYPPLALPPLSLGGACHHAMSIQILQKNLLLFKTVD